MQKHETFYLSHWDNSFYRWDNSYVQLRLLKHMGQFNWFYYVFLRLQGSTCYIRLLWLHEIFLKSTSILCNPHRKKRGGCRGPPGYPSHSPQNVIMQPFYFLQLDTLKLFHKDPTYTSENCALNNVHFTSLVHEPSSIMGTCPTVFIFSIGCAYQYPSKYCWLYDLKISLFGEFKITSL